jgi:hypothetical protein
MYQISSRGQLTRGHPPWELCKGTILHHNETACYEMLTLDLSLNDLGNENGYEIWNRECLEFL